MPAPLPCLIIAGATASGKSALAISIAEAIGGEIVNADSMQLYRDLPILTAIPDADDQARVPHHGYAMVDGGARFSVASWLAASRDSIAAIRARGRVPILVGGTGLYLRAAIEGIAPIPDIPDAIRAEAIALHASLGGAAFRAKLSALDPVLADRLEDGDSQRLIRGMEVALATGQPLSTLQQRPQQGMLAPPLVPVLVEVPRDRLYQRIDARFPAMLEQGGIDEAKTFARRRLDPSLPLMKAVGVPPLLAWLDGAIDRDEAIALACRDTRRLAKRQLTWFRHQYHPKAVLTGDEDAQHLKRFLIKILPNVIFKA